MSENPLQVLTQALIHARELRVSITGGKNGVRGSSPGARRKALLAAGPQQLEDLTATHARLTVAYEEWRATKGWPTEGWFESLGPQEVAYLRGVLGEKKKLTAMAQTRAKSLGVPLELRRLQSGRQAREGSGVGSQA